MRRQRSEEPVDVAVVGGGVAGLLTAYRILERYSHWHVTVLESVHVVGGRTRTARFAGLAVSAGAGVGRGGKDVRLAALLQELDLPVHVRGATPRAPPRQVARLAALVQAKEPGPDMTFRTFARQVLGDAEFRAFLTTMGHTDMLDAQAQETMRHYGLEDNVLSWTPFTVPWNDLCERLRARILAFPNGRVRTGQHVDEVHWPSTWRPQAARPSRATYARLTLSGGTHVRALRVVLAVPINELTALAPAWYWPAISTVRAQPFIRVYVRVAREHAPLVAASIGYFRVVSPSPLMKMSTVDAAKGVFMAAFADGPAAVHLAQHLVVGPDTRDAAKLYLATLITDALGLNTGPRKGGKLGRGVVHLTSFTAFWFPVGTHYYAPDQGSRDEEVRRALLHHDRLFVVGEAVSHNQGWTEGALETVDAAVPRIK
jgi:hypothetical protein